MKSNFRKKLSFVLSGFILVLASIFMTPFAALAEDDNDDNDDAVDIDAESAILVDADTGKILYAKDPDEALPPASMTKMMTEYLVWEAVENGEISWDDTTQISDYPYSISANIEFSGVGLRQGKDYTVEELYEAMAVNSDNATTIALAELIAGSESDFVKMMNEKAEEMGLPEYKFVNSTGLDNASLGDNIPEGTDEDETNLLSAESSALLGYYLVRDYPEALEISGKPTIEFEDEEIRNWNWMLDHDAESLEQFHYDGVDGLKTGHTELAKYTFTGTAEQDGKRLISVVMKSESREKRFHETAELFDYGFSKFEEKEVFQKGYQLDEQETVPVAKGKKESVGIETENAFTLPVKEGDGENYKIRYSLDEEKLDEDGSLTAPVEKDEKVGVAEIVYEGDVDYGYIFEKEGKQTVDLVTQDSVEKENWFMLILGAIGNFFSNLFSSLVDMVKGWF